MTTCGQSGAGLGSDEKEVVLLIYVIIDVQTNNVSTRGTTQPTPKISKRRGGGGKKEEGEELPSGNENLR